MDSTGKLAAMFPTPALIYGVCCLQCFYVAIKLKCSKYELEYFFFMLCIQECFPWYTWSLLRAHSYLWAVSRGTNDLYDCQSAQGNTFPPPLWVTRRDVKWLEIANFKPIFSPSVYAPGSFTTAHFTVGCSPAFAHAVLQRSGHIPNPKRKLPALPTKWLPPPPAGHCRPQPWPSASARACGGAGESFVKPGKCPLWEPTYPVLWGKILRGFLLVAGAWVSGMEPCEARCRRVPVAPSTAWPLSTTSGTEGSGTAKWCPAARCEQEKKKKKRNPSASPEERREKGGAGGSAAWGRHCPAAPQHSAKMQQETLHSTAASLLRHNFLAYTLFYYFWKAF